MKNAKIPALVESVVAHNFTLIKNPMQMDSSDTTFVKQRYLAAKILTNIFRDHSKKLSTAMPN